MCVPRQRKALRIVYVDKKEEGIAYADRGKYYVFHTHLDRRKHCVLHVHIQTNTFYRQRKEEDISHADRRR